jgi:hypothetical protein
MMQGVLAFQESFVGASTIAKIRKISKDTITKQDETLLARWGLSVDDAIKIKDQLALHTDDNLEVFNFKNMDEVVVEKLRLAVNRNLKDNVIEGNSIHNAHFLKTAGPVAKIILQFLRFPLTAQTILLKRGFQDEPAALIAGMAGNLLAYGALQYLVEEAKVSSGLIEDSKRKYDIFNDPDHMLNLIAKSFSYIGALGTISVGYDYLAAVTKLPKAGSTYEARGDSIIGVLGPTASMTEDISKYFYKLSAGEPLNEYEKKRARILIPFITLPFVKELLEETFNHFD